MEDQDVSYALVDNLNEDPPDRDPVMPEPHRRVSCKQPFKASDTPAPTPERQVLFPDTPPSTPAKPTSGASSSSWEMVTATKVVLEDGEEENSEGKPSAPECPRCRWPWIILLNRL